MFILALRFIATGSNVGAPVLNPLVTMNECHPLVELNDGWHVATDRPPTLFTTLRDATKAYNRVKTGIFTQEEEVRPLAEIIFQFDEQRRNLNLGHRVVVELQTLMPHTIDTDEVDLEML